MAAFERTQKRSSAEEPFTPEQIDFFYIGIWDVLERVNSAEGVTSGEALRAQGALRRIVEQAKHVRKETP